MQYSWQPKAKAPLSLVLVPYSPFLSSLRTNQTKPDLFIQVLNVFPELKHIFGQLTSRFLLGNQWKTFDDVIVLMSFFEYSYMSSSSCGDTSEYFVLISNR